jgi:hypothetical protein
VGRRATRPAARRPSSYRIWDEGPGKEKSRGGTEGVEDATGRPAVGEAVVMGDEADNDA